MLFMLLGLMLGLSALCLCAMAYVLFKQPALPLTYLDYIKLTVSGFIAFIADTFGVGSFAVNVALSKFLGTFKDEELPGAVNGAQVLPGMIESIFFMQLIEVDLLTLFVLVAGTCLGGVLGSGVVSRLSQQAIRATMVVCFSVLICLLMAYQWHLMPLGGDEVALYGMKLGIGFFAMMVCGGLTCAGVGLFVMVQSVLFLLNISPEVAFPIMTTAGAMQQPLTTLAFLKQGRIPLKKTWVLSLAGCLGVFVSLPVFNALSTDALRMLLMGVLFYNVFGMGRAFLRARRTSVLIGVAA
ncbi:MAG: sulfite exporter TauE/SafE family protein [Gammaproteobacteria bacterium]|nr:sulfite exporter TauE/SafE family protein [Gammaproteobacteria bacterium]